MYDFPRKSLRDCFQLFLFLNDLPFVIKTNIILSVQNLVNMVDVEELSQTNSLQKVIFSGVSWAAVFENECHYIFEDNI